MTQHCCGPCVAQFRLGELLPVTQSEEPNVSIGDVTVNRHVNPSLVKIHLKSSKTNQFRQGVDIFVGANKLCPVAALLAYLALRGSRYGPVFVNQTGLPLTKGSFVENLRAALKGVAWDKR